MHILTNSQNESNVIVEILKVLVGKSDYTFSFLHTRLITEWFLSGRWEYEAEYASLRDDFHNRLNVNIISFQLLISTVKKYEKLDWKFYRRKFLEIMEYSFFQHIRLQHVTAAKSKPLKGYLPAYAP